MGPGIIAGQLTRLSATGHAAANPTFSPDGTTVAYRDTSGGNQIYTVEVSTSPAAPTPVAGAFGIPTYQPTQTNFVLRASGIHRYGTAVDASRFLWPDDGASPVVLARADNFADALGGATLAAKKAARCC